MTPNSKRTAALGSGLRADTWDLRAGELDGRRLKRYVKSATNKHLRKNAKNNIRAGQLDRL